MQILVTEYRVGFREKNSSIGRLGNSNPRAGLTVSAGAKPRLTTARFVRIAVRYAADGAGSLLSGRMLGSVAHCVTFLAVRNQGRPRGDHYLHR